MNQIRIAEIPSSEIRKAFSLLKVRCVVCEERRTGDYLDAWLSAMGLGDGIATIEVASSPRIALAKAMIDEPGKVCIFWFKATQAHLVWDENGGDSGAEHFCFSQICPVNDNGKQMLWLGGMSKGSATLIRETLFGS